MKLIPGHYVIDDLEDFAFLVLKTDVLMSTILIIFPQMIIVKKHNKTLEMYYDNADVLNPY